MYKLVSNKVLFYGSVITLLYFLSLLFINIIDLDVVIIRVFAELLTIPFVLLLIFITIFSIIKLIKEKIYMRSDAFKALLLSITTIVLLILATIFE